MAGEQYFAERPLSRSARREVRLDLADGSLRLATDAGVFSAGAVDVGTKLLLLTVPPPPPAGEVLDLGCGYGPIALTLARRAPGATVWAVDVNERARALCRENAEANGLGNVTVAAPAEVPAAVAFATIWSNPPVRIGKAALHALLERWFGRLAPEGDAWLVVQRHLGADSLASWLATVGYAVERVASRQGYRILHVRPAVAADPDPAADPARAPATEGDG
jgi:16S rRNA (guanine1207-N2)-methyltransferase